MSFSNSKVLNFHDQFLRMMIFFIIINLQSCLVPPPPKYVDYVSKMISEKIKIDGHARFAYQKMIDFKIYLDINNSEDLLSELSNFQLEFLNDDIGLSEIRNSHVKVYENDEQINYHLNSEESMEIEKQIRLLGKSSDSLTLIIYYETPEIRYFDFLESERYHAISGSLRLDEIHHKFDLVKK